MSLDAPIVSALRAIASGVTPAHDMGPTVAGAMDAIATAACTDSHSTKLSDTFTVHALRICPADDGGRIYWEDPHSSSSTPHTANACWGFDAGIGMTWFDIGKLHELQGACPLSCSSMGHAMQRRLARGGGGCSSCINGCGSFFLDPA